MAISIDSARMVITGAGSGIGRATALECARRGASVVALDLDGDAAEATAEACADRNAASYTCDVADPEALVALAGQVEQEQGPVDVLVNNAGVGMAGPFLESTVEDWQWLRGINLDGVAYGCHAFAPAMVARRRGHLVNLASMAGYMAQGSMAPYCSAKAGVIMFSQCLRAELAPQGVGVSAICPGVINTPIAESTRLIGSMSGKRSQVLRGFSFGHSPDAVARAIMRAVERNRELVPVGIESSVAYRLLRLAPPSVRGALARVQLR